MKNLILLLSLLSLLPLSAWAEIFEARVVKVSDGDTITVLRQDKTRERIRFLGIDAPEKKQDFGQKSKEVLLEKIGGKLVQVEFKKRDRYGRILGKVLFQKEDINLSQVQNGLAWHYKHYQKDQSKADKELYAKAEEQARIKKLGIWSNSKTALSPWEFRKSARKVASSKKAKKSSIESDDEE